MTKPEAFDLSVVIPAYNEEGRLGPTLAAYDAYLLAAKRRAELIVVDDGSSDGTSAVARGMVARYAEIRLIRLAENRGKGYAVRSGIVNAMGRRILFADADGATPLSEVERLDAALDAGADVAIGSRAFLDAGVTIERRLYRHLIGRTYHRLVELLTVRGIKDTQCGFKLFDGRVADDLFSRMRMSGFSFDVELLMMAQRRGYRIAEVPVNWSHQSGSKINLVLDSARMARDLFVIHAHAVRGHYDRPHLASTSLDPA